MEKTSCHCLQCLILCRLLFPLLQRVWEKFSPRIIGIKFNKRAMKWKRSPCTWVWNPNSSSEGISTRSAYEVHSRNQTINTVAFISKLTCLWKVTQFFSSSQENNSTSTKSGIRGEVQTEDKAHGITISCVGGPVSHPVPNFSLLAPAHLLKQQRHNIVEI